MKKSRENFCEKSWKYKKIFFVKSGKKLFVNAVKKSWKNSKKNILINLKKKFKICL